MTTHTRLCTLAVALTSCLTACTPDAASGDSSDTGAHLLMRYNAPARYFEESLPLGNGTLGALVYGGIRQEQISLNDITLWTGEPDLKPWTPGASQHLPTVRALLDREDYPAAERANMLIEGHNSEIYQPLGTLLLSDLKATTDSADSHYLRTLDLSQALAEVTYHYAEGDSYQVRDCFVSAPDSVIVIRLKAYGTSLHYRIGLQGKVPNAETHSADGAIAVEGYAAYSTKPEAGKDEWFHYDPERGIHFRTELQVQVPEGCVHAESDSTLIIEGCDEALLLLTNVTSYNGPYRDPVRAGRDYRAAVAQRLDRASRLSYDALLSRHLEDYQRLFRRVQLDLGSTPDSLRSLPTDQQLLSYSSDVWADSLAMDSVEHLFNPDLEELYFQYGRYLLIASSRTPGVPANLQGLWNESLTPPWSGNYTVNINVEENYWPAETAALPEMHQSLLSWIQQLPQSGALSARNYYDCSGWTVCHNSDPWCMTNPVGYQRESPMWACWPLGGAWVSTHLWEHYTFTRDTAFLSQAFPVMMGAAQFCMDYLVERDGHLITSPSTSPENEYRLADGFIGATFYGGTADIAMIRELLTDVRQAASVLDRHSEQLARVDQTLSQLLPYRIGREGNLQEWYHDWMDKDPHHRHQSHLFGLYPGHQITVEATPELAQACARTLEFKGDRTTGWSAGWRVNLLAHLHDGHAAYHMLRRLLTFVHPEGYQGEGKRHGGGTYANLFDAHPPFQIDGNFGGTAGMIEMLVQSRWVNEREAEATLLPALPTVWRPEGRISGVRLRGGFELSMEWRDSRVTQLDVKRIGHHSAKLRVTSSDGQTWSF